MAFRTAGIIIVHETADYSQAFHEEEGRGAESLNIDKAFSGVEGMEWARTTMVSGCMQSMVKVLWELETRHCVGVPYRSDWRSVMEARRNC